MIGQTISHYKIIAKLGEGGMGVVYQAEDLDLKVTRALKFLPSHAADDEEHLARLKHEAQAAASLEHPNICQVHEIGQDQGQTFIVMSYLEGRTLEDRLAHEAPLPIPEAMNIANEVSDALKRAHAAGIVHRDIKPANIMLTAGGQAVVMDFGLAKTADQTRLTKTGTTLGTAAYMSPEQMQGKTVDARADLWALGVMLYEMVTGQVPFAGANLPAVVYAVQHKEPASLSEIRPEVSSDLERVLDRTLAKDPQLRYQTAGELMGDLEAVRDEQDLARKTALYDRRQRLKRRKRVLFGVVTAIVIAAVALSWWTRHQDLNRIDALAVLPFANLSGDKGQEFFSDGMTETLITELQQLTVGKIRVIGRTSVMRYKDTELSLPEIAAELGVDAIVEASVIRTGDLVKIAAKLIRARPEERQVWADTYERDLRDIMSLHANVARNVAEQLGVLLDGLDQDSRQVDPKAYEEYLIGTHIMNTTGDTDLAFPHFEKAMEIDPTYAPAYASAAHCKIMPVHAWPFEGPVEEARKLAEKSIELDPTNAFGFYTLGHILYEHELEFQKAHQAFQKALDLNPEHGVGLLTYAFFATATGRNREAGEAASRAIQVDPFNFLILARAHPVFLNAGRYEEFLSEMDRLKKLKPGSDYHGMMSTYHRSKGEYEKAMELWTEHYDTKDKDERFMYSNETYLGLNLRKMALMKWYAGEVDEAREFAEQWLEVEDLENVSLVSAAVVFAILDDKDHSMDCLEKAYDQGDILVVRIQDPCMSWALTDLLASEPRYDQFIEKIGLKD